MTNFYTILSFTGSIASIVGLIISACSKNTNQKKLNVVLYVIILALSIFAGITYNNYKKLIDKRLDIENRKQNAKLEAQALLETFPYSTSVFAPGENEGIAISTMALIEKNKDLWPETYDSFKKTVQQKIDMYHKEPNSFDNQELMEAAAIESIRFVKSLAQHPAH